MLPQAPASPFAPAADTSLAGRTVLVIIPALSEGRAARETLDVAAALAAAGARPLVATSGGRLVSELQARGGVWVPFPADSRNPLAMLRNVRALAAVIRDERPALVHAQSRAAAWVALGATRLTGTPFMTTYHGGYGARHAVAVHYNSVMARGQLVLAQSHFTGDAVATLYPWARERVRVIWPGVDLRSFNPATVDAARVVALRSAWGVEPDQRIVLMAGRLADWKGPRVLVEALALLDAEAHGDVVAVLCGDAGSRPATLADIDALARARGLADRVRRVGHCADMPGALMTCAALVVPSIRPEPFSAVAVEAQAMGKPVIVSAVGAAPETVLASPDVSPEERTGWRVPPGDAPALAEALGEVLGSGASALDALAFRARAHAEARFSRDGMTESMLDAYAALLDRAAAQAPLRRAA